MPQMLDDGVDKCLITLARKESMKDMSLFSITGIQFNRLSETCLLSPEATDHAWGTASYIPGNG